MAISHAFVRSNGTVPYGYPLIFYSCNCGTNQYWHTTTEHRSTQKQSWGVNKKYRIPMILSLKSEMWNLNKLAKKILFLPT